MKEQYATYNFQRATLELIETMNVIVADYQRQGFVLTVRQLYYQLVARALIENTERSYKRITATVNDARLAGLMDWDAIEDRTRAFDTRSRWTSGGAILNAVASQYHQDMWELQEMRPFVIVEKEALAGVLGGVCREYDVPLLAARGYPSVSVLREFAKNVLIPRSARQTLRLIHLGDHDPSGIDMTRDLRERLELLSYDSGAFTLSRVALNMAQVEEQKPPPNPAKTTDSRFQDYQELYGDESWELDALQPSYLVALVEGAIQDCIQPAEWQQTRDEIDDVRLRLRELAEGFDQEESE